MHQNFEQKTGPVSRLHAIYRGTIFQAVILSLISFTQPEIWSALNTGGQAEPYVVNAANVITFAIMVFGAPLASVVANVIVFGTIGCVPYSAALIKAYFSVRSRALVGFLVAFVGAIVNILCGWWLDTRWVKRSTQAHGTWLATLALFTAMWIWYLVEGRADIAFEVILVWLYWAVAAFDSDADAISVTVGILRAGQSLGEAFSYGVGAARSASLLTNLVVAFVVFFVSDSFTTWAAWIVPERLLGEDDDVVISNIHIILMELLRPQALSAQEV
ncbi:hypothetical protein IWX90DRAFT_481930 [Phyllosticta citrichinensis]|uniref:Uncharacterized protein n=1 Tax=Phyllosticta citrichinensis TaxID=1130410 RepID=A0ABR1Y4U3_9PEZI